MTDIQKKCIYAISRITEDIFYDADLNTIQDSRLAIQKAYSYIDELNLDEAIRLIIENSICNAATSRKLPRLKRKNLIKALIEQFKK